MELPLSVHITNDIEASNDTVTTTNSNHIASIIKVSCVNSSTQIGDGSRRLEVVSTIENLGLVGNGTTSDNQVTSGLLELC